MSLEIANKVQAHCTLFRQFDYRLVWKAEEHYVPGTQIELRCHRLRSFISWRYAKMSIDGADVTFRWKLRPSISEMFNNVFSRSKYMIIRATLPYGVRQGQEVAISLTMIPHVWAGINEILSVWITDVRNPFNPSAPVPEARKELDSDCEMTVVAGPVERFSIYSRPFPGADGSIRTLMVPEDRFGNPAKFAREVPMDLEWNGRQWREELSETKIVHLDRPNGVGRLKATIAMNSLDLGENISNGQRVVDKLVVTGNPVWSEMQGGLRPAYGEFHWHTDISGDGQRELSQALQFARDGLNMDFAAPSDHGTAGEDWKNTVTVLEDFNRPGEFTTLFGWENGGDRGHENYYFTTPDHPLVCNGSAGVSAGNPEIFVEKLSRQKDFIAIPHHPNAVSESRKQEDDSPYWHPYPWGKGKDYIRLVEIFQCRGNQEMDVCEDSWRGWHQNNHASVQDALKMGYKLGFTGGTDNHCGYPGRAFAECEGSGAHPIYSVILTGVWTGRLERQNVFNALSARHTWAVWDTRAIVHFTVNGVLGGGELSVQKDELLVARILLSADDAIQVMEIISDGRAVWAGSSDELDIDLKVPLGRVAKNTHYYFRALQRNGGITYASPVFVTTDAEKLP
ncbi:MAG: DUF3604 domain-containing protein [Victivallales bacterium]